MYNERPEDDIDASLRNARRTILIHGAGFSNKGAEAMLRTVRTELGRRLPQATFCMRVLPADVALARDAGVEPLVIRRGKLRSGMRLLLAAVSDPQLARIALRFPKGAAVLVAVRDVDALVDVSGFSFSDTWGAGNAMNHLAAVSYLSGRGARCLYMPQAWGPFSNPRVAELTAEFCRRVDLAYARDDESRRHLSNLPDVPTCRIETAHDIAFRFQAAPLATGERYLDAFGISAEEDCIVGIAPNLRVYERTPGLGLENTYVQLLARLARLCTERFNAKVVLVPHEIGASVDGDDRYLCGLIQDASGKPPVVAAMMGEYSAPEVKSVIGWLDLLVGSRYHSLIAALSQRVPTVALGWAHKYGELMKAVGLAEYQSDIESAQGDPFLELVARAWENRAQMRLELRRTIPQMEESVDRVFDTAARVICRGQK